MPRAADTAYEELRRLILGGDMAAGERLGEAELAERLSLSRTPVREALQRLSLEGLVELLPHKGARVVQWTAADLAEIFDLRALLEPYGAAGAARRGVPAETLARLHELCDGMERAAAGGDLQLLGRLNSELHGLVLTASGNGRLQDLVRTVVHVPLVIGTFARYDQDSLDRSMHHHRELVAALEARDPDWAEAVMRSHIRAAATSLIARTGETS